MESFLGLCDNIVRSHRSGPGHKTISKALNDPRSTVLPLVVKWKSYDASRTLPRVSYAARQSRWAQEGRGSSIFLNQIIFFLDIGKKILKDFFVIMADGVKTVMTLRFCLSGQNVVLCEMSFCIVNCCVLVDFCEMFLFCALFISGQRGWKFCSGCMCCVLSVVSLTFLSQTWSSWRFSLKDSTGSSWSAEAVARLSPSTPERSAPPLPRLPPLPQPRSSVSCTPILSSTLLHDHVLFISVR